MIKIKVFRQARLTDGTARTYIMSMPAAEAVKIDAYDPKRIFDAITGYSETKPWLYAWLENVVQPGGDFCISWKMINDLLFSAGDDGNLHWDDTQKDSCSCSGLDNSTISDVTSKILYEGGDSTDGRKADNDDCCCQPLDTAAISDLLTANLTAADH